MCRSIAAVSGSTNGAMVKWQTLADLGDWGMLSGQFFEAKTIGTVAFDEEEKFR